MALFQLKEVNGETVRIGNLCSTRMNATQVMTLRVDLTSSSSKSLTRMQKQSASSIHF
jgi:hypothetical protein